MSFNRRLEQKMQQRGFSGSQVAQLVGVSPMAVSNWRNGRTVPRQEAFERLAQVLGSTVPFLRDGIKDDAQRPAVKSGPRTQAEIIADARREIAAIAGLPVSQVILEVRFANN